MAKQKTQQTPTNLYWPPELDNIIDQFNKEQDLDVREEIFRKHLHFPLSKMCESIINRFKFPYIHISFLDLKHQVISYLVVNMHKYSPEKGKSYSYFSIIAKNYLIFNNNLGYKHEKVDVSITEEIEDAVTLSEEPIEIAVENHAELHKDYKEFVKLLVNYWENNITKYFKKKRDIEIAYAIIELFRKVDKIENFNKKALYIMIREMTDAKAPYITRVLTVMKKKVYKQYQQFLSEGYITDPEYKFFEYTKQ